MANVAKFSLLGLWGLGWRKRGRFLMLIATFVSAGSFVYLLILFTPLNYLFLMCQPTWTHDMIFSHG